MTPRQTEESPINSDTQFSPELSSVNEVPPVDSDASGTASFSVNDDVILYTVEASGN